MNARAAARALALAGTFLLAAGAARAQTTVQLFAAVAENGVGSYGAAGVFSASLNSSMAPDPGPGGLPSVLRFDLSPLPAFATGDVLMTEPGAQYFLDVVRFDGTTHSLFFYSDNVEGYDDLADTSGPPAEFYSNVATIDEVGPEGDNGAIYTPTPNQPGYVPGVVMTYFITSDVVSTPEPASLALLATGLIGLGVVAVRRRRNLLA